MATKVSIQLKGLDSLKARVLNLIPRVRQGTGDAVVETLLLIEGTAKQLAPVDTGRLRASIHAEPAANRLSGTVSTNVEYAPAMEFGTRYISPRPFLFPALEMHRQDFLAALKANIKLL